MSAAHRTVAPPTALPRSPGRRDRLRALRARRRGVRVGAGVVLGRGLTFDGAPGLEIADGARIGDGCRFHLAPGAQVRIGPDAVLGERCAISAHERVEIGAHSILADEVVLADFGPSFEDADRPTRLQPLQTAPVIVGDAVRVGPGAALLRGVRVGDGAQIGAHAVVTRDVAAGAAVDGVPAATPPPPRVQRPARRARAGRAPR